MESNNISGEPAPENNPDQNQQMQLLQAQSQTRTYECNFCKRGFSNAQALGGHMNIHRKDKVKAKKLKHHPPQNPPNHQHQFLLDISSNTLTAPPLEQFKSHNFQDQRPPNIMLPNCDFREGDYSGTYVDDDDDDEENGFLEPELDLELRLGHEPTQSNTTPMGTRKFF